MTNQTENTVPSVQESLPETETGGSAPSSSQHKRITILLLCLTVVLLTAGGFLMARFLRHPLKKSVEAGRQSIQDLEASPLGVFSDNLNRHGSFLMGVNTSELSDLLSDLLPLPLHLDAAAELEVFSQDGDLALRAGAQLKGRTLLDGLVLYREGKELAVSSEAFFGRTNYGLNLKTISRNLPNSVLNPSSGSPYALPERLYNYLISTDFREKDFRRLTEEGRAQFRKLVDRGADYLIQKARFQTGRSSITIGEEKINARTLTVMLDGETFCGLLKELIDFCRDNAGFRDYFLQLMGKLSLLFEDASPDNLKKSYLDFLQKLEEELPTLQESLKGAEFTAVSYMNGSRLLRQELRAKQQEEEVFLALTIGPDPREPKEISLEFRESGGAVFTASYRITSRDAQQYSGKLTLHSGASDLAYVNINWNKDSGAFTLLVELLESQNSFQLNGSLKKEGSITRFDLEKLAVSDASSTSNLPIRGIYLIWNEQAKFPLLNNYTEITSMNEEQISAVFDDVQKTFSELITTLLAAFGF